jgi:hypothetical protein
MRVIIVVLIMLNLLSCSDNIVSIVEPNNGYYFVGNVFGKEKRFIDGENDYRVSTDVGGNSNSNIYSMSIYKFPLEKYDIGDEWISISTPDVTELDSMSLLALFTPRKLIMPTTIETMYQGFCVSYYRVTGKHYDSIKDKWTIDKAQSHTYYGEQSGSNLEIVSSRILDEGTNYPVIEAKFSINCKLYDVNGKFVGSISRGVFKGKLHLWKFF